MKEARLFLAVMLCGAVVKGQAQDAPAAKASRAGTTGYFDEAGKKLPSAVGADHRIETTYRDSLAGTVRVFYMPSGKLKSYTPFADVRHHLRHGTYSQYYESGQLQVQATYVAGKCVGDFVTYYADGTPKRRDHYEQGGRTTGECFGPDGKAVPYFPYELMPVYSEGSGDNAAVVHAVMLNTHYPKEALRRRVSGVVKIEFVVDKTGHVQRVRPNEQTRTAPVPPHLTDAYLELQEAAMEAVRQLKPFAPGRQDGEPVNVSFTVPVTFSINRP